MRKQKGFSIIELLIVVEIILIIAAVAIPNLLRARIAANESSAVASARTLNTAQISYNSAYPTVGFASSFGQSGRRRTGMEILVKRILLVEDSRFMRAMNERALVRAG